MMKTNGRRFQMSPYCCKVFDIKIFCSVCSEEGKKLHFDQDIVLNSSSLYWAVLSMKLPRTDES